MLAVEIENLVIRYGTFEAVRGVSVDAREGEFVTLVGPSGCGKTTTLRAIAGLEAPTSGRISLFGRTVFDSEKHIDVPTEFREISMVFQSYAIWPHMTVFDNVAYGLRVKKTPKEEIHGRVMKALEMVGLAEYAQREAPMLSGGQQQRVALARSFVFNPKVLLFDEPLSNLDAKLRAQMRIELKELTAKVGITSIYVTHDQEEALALSDKVVVMDRGIIRQQADPLTIYFRPIDRYVADFMGASNIIEVKSASPDSSGAIRAQTMNGGVIIGSGPMPKQGAAAVAIKSVHLNLTQEYPEGAPNAWKVTVTRRVFVGDVIEYFVNWDGIELRSRELSTKLFEEGQAIFCNVSPDHAVLLPHDDANA
jgi:iron(III) transport system ATP-binding protein